MQIMARVNWRARIWRGSRASCGSASRSQPAVIACITAVVSALAGKNASTASSDKVTSAGVPKIVIVEMKDRTRSPIRNSNGIAIASASLRSLRGTCGAG